jgi:DNA-binding transcriptional ArsR family regulator
MGSSAKVRDQSRSRHGTVQKAVAAAGDRRQGTIVCPTSPGRARARQEEAAHLFAALGDETRLRLVTRLCDDGPQSITRLTAGTNVTRQAITKHLRVMEGSGLVRNMRQGRESVWELDQRRLAEARQYLDTISAQWDAALGRLREFVEKKNKPRMNTNEHE